MAPKRARLAAAEAAQVVSVLENGASETLANASGQNVTQFLKKASRRRAKFSGTTEPPLLLPPTAVAAAAGLMPGLPGARQQQLPGACGAVAVAGRDEVEGPEEEAEEAPQGAAAVKGGSGSDEGAAAYQQAQAQQDWSDEEQWEDAWGEEGGEEEGEEDEEEGDAAAGDRTEGTTEGLTISLDSEHGQAKPSRRPTQLGGPRRLGVTKVDRLRAQLLHRTHLLCLLARGRQLDAATGDPLLQAQLVSLLEPGPEAKLYEGEVLSTAAVSLRGVRQQLSWLHRTFRLRPLPGGGGEDPVAAAFLQATGLPGAVQQLREAVEQRRCGGEQLVAVFAALLRAQGASVRLVCALHASPLRPTDADRLSQRALATLSKQFGTAAAPYLPQAAPLPPAGVAIGGPAACAASPGMLAAARHVAAAAAELMSGRLAAAVDAQRALVARQCSLPDASPVYWVSPGMAASLKGVRQHTLPAGNQMVVDDNRAHQLKKKAWKERRAARDAGGGGGTARASTSGSAFAFSFEPPGGSGGGGGGRGRGKPGSGGKGGRGARAQPPAAASVLTAAGSCAGLTSISSGSAIDKKGRSNSAPAAAAAFHAAVDSVEAVDEEQAEQAGQEEQRKTVARRKRKGDLAEEAELAAALAASEAAAAQPASPVPPLPVAATAAADAGAGAPSQPKAVMRGRKAATAKGGSGKGAADSPASPTIAAARDGGGSGSVAVGGATLNEQRPDVGQCWLEVFCWDFGTEPCTSGSNVSAAAGGRWVHVDPLTLQVDSVALVEANLPKHCQPLAYVTALAGGGAKDVTQRYTSNWAVASQKRDEEWWQQTLEPLKELQHAASMAAQANGIAATITANGGGGGKDGGGKGGSKAGAAAREDLGPRAAAVARKRQRQAEAADRGAVQLAAEREDAELAERAQRALRSIPSTVDGFRTHSAYVLQRHIPKYQAIVPGADKAGMHRGEPYFKRSDLQELHTVTQWRTEGWEVRPEELASPYKRVKRRGSSARSKTAAAAAAAAVAEVDGWARDGGEEEDGEEGTGEQAAKEDTSLLTSLYGKWQTSQWMPAVASGGKVPRSAGRDNIEVPPFVPSLPVGTVHLQLPYIALTCRRLKVDFVKAMTGFEAVNGRSVPKFDGVVICQEHEQEVVDAHLQAEREREARKQAKADAEADAAWRLLLRGLLARVRLQQDYGGAQTGAEADAAAALLQHGSPTGAVAGRKRGRGGAKTTARAAAKDEVIDLASSDSDGGPAAAAAAVPVRKGVTRGLRSKLQAAVPAGRQQRQQLDEEEQEEQPAHMAGVKEEEI